MVLVGVLSSKFLLKTLKRLTWLVPPKEGKKESGNNQGYTNLEAWVRTITAGTLDSSW